MRALKPLPWAAAVVTKDVTFNNTAADVDLFTVTGDVIVSVFGICKTDLASAGACNANVGVAGALTALIALTDVTTIDVGEVWAAAAPATTYSLMTVNNLVGCIIPNGQKITLGRSAQIDSGRILFYCLWTPLSADGNVVAA